MAKLSIINKLAMGTVQFGLDYGISNNTGQTSGSEAEKILRVAQQSGITLLDTAWGYGTSEEVLGSTLPAENPFEIVSKFPAPALGSAVSDYARQSLQRLGIRKFYGYLAHTPDVLTQNKTRWRELETLRNEGLVSKIGYSLYSPWELDELLSLGLMPDLVQVPYNILDRRFEPYFKMLTDNGVEIHTRSAFLQGLFFMEPDKLSAFFDSAKPMLSRIRSNFSSMNELSGALLYFCVCHPAVSRVVVGVNTADQLAENIDGLKKAKIIEWPFFPIEDETILLPYRWPKK